MCYLLFQVENQNAGNISLMTHDSRGLKMSCDKEKYDHLQILKHLTENKRDYLKKLANVRAA
jgi:hypothetical protein